MIKNTLSATAENKMVEYAIGTETVKLSPKIIKDYLVNGNGDITDQEAVMFLNLCKYQHINPFLREAYLIKFGSQPATMVVGKDFFVKRARNNPDCKGFVAGIIVIDKEGNVSEREGTFKLPSETLVGGWAKVYVKGFEKPISTSVTVEEYIGTTKDGAPNSNWTKRPATMIRKVALAQALREAFPDNFGGLYTAEELNVDDTELSDTPVEMPKEEAPVVDIEPEEDCFEDTPFDDM